MNNFTKNLEKQGEVGFVEEVRHSVAQISGLPGVHPSEVVMFETGEVGQILSLNKDSAEVLLLTSTKTTVGTRVARTGEVLAVGVGESLLGNHIDPLGRSIINTKKITGLKEKRVIDVTPTGITTRKHVDQPLETGVGIVDLVIPLGKGQRELVVGDRKTGKTQFLQQVVLTQAKQGTVCIYAAIAKRSADIAKTLEFFAKNEILDKTIMVSAPAEAPAGLIYLTPYTAMTIAEYFRDQGKDVLVILDDLTAHASYYREITLLARRFPGRSSYPGDIFYTHSRLIERAGNFKKGSISCLPVAEAVMGDISGYIQTNLMSMTDGHIFFDSELANLGKRPPVNPFLSVTRVGLQAQSPLMRDVNRELTRFLVQQERIRQFLHFGAELSENIKQDLALGDRVYAIFDQSNDEVVPSTLNTIFVAAVWAGIWTNTDIPTMKIQTGAIRNTYEINPEFKKEIDVLFANANKFGELVNTVHEKRSDIISIAENEKRKSN